MGRSHRVFLGGWRAPCSIALHDLYVTKAVTGAKVSISDAIFSREELSPSPSSSECLSQSSQPRETAQEGNQLVFSFQQ